MPAKTGASHGIAAFATFIIGTVFSKFVWNVLPPLGELSLMLMTMIRSQIGLSVPLSERLAGTVVIMVLLSFLWGVIYHITRH